MYIKNCPHCNKEINLNSTADIAVCPYCKKEIKKNTKKL